MKAVHIFSFLTLLILLSAVWGLEQSEIAVFVGTILTALGIAFFAQWSLLSNITSSLLLFFNHPIKIGDRINPSCSKTVNNPIIYQQFEG